MGIPDAGKGKLEYTRPVVNQVIMIGGTGLEHFE